MQIKYASFGSVSEGTLKQDELLMKFLHTLQWHMMQNKEALALPESDDTRKWLLQIESDAQACFDDDGELLESAEGEQASGILAELGDALETFAPPYGYFGAHVGDGADFGFWPINPEEIKEQVEFSSSESQEYPPADFRGEWLHVNERGNCTLYVREENGADREIWSLV
jgi:hypothetical protein